MDLDGDLDLLVATIGPEDSTDPDLYFKIYENRTETENYYSQIELEGTSSQRDAFGAIVYIFPSSSNPQMNVLYSGGTHCSQNSKVIHFGLGSSESIDSLRIEWPSGIEQTLRNIPINEKIKVREGINDFEIVGCTISEAKTTTKMPP